MRHTNVPGGTPRSAREAGGASGKRGLPMRTLWVLTLGLVALTTAEGCKRRIPEPIPGPKAGPVAVGRPAAAGIAWFQGSLDEAFARPDDHATCTAERAPMAPLPDLSRMRKWLNTPSPTACRGGACPSAPSPRRPLV